ncbi:MAG: FG-GAP-like repeat-containing protein [Bacteroidota bacterium]
MKKALTLLVMSALSLTYMIAQVHLGAKFVPKKTTTNPDSAYFGDIGIRGSWVAPDLDNDGKPEILVTDYTKTGRVHAFQAAGNDTLEWIWSSPRLDTVAGLPYGAGGSSTPRTIRHGDMDGDGKGEIIFPRGSAAGGYLIFEWNGVNGSHNFGTKPSAFVPANVPYGPNFGTLAGTANEGGLQLTVEHFEVMDVDGDGVQELVLPKNLGGSINDDFLVISAVGTWEFEDQGFASFQIEGGTGRIASTYFGGGAPYAIHPADLDGDGKKELVCHNWNFLDYWVIKVTGADTYVIPDTANSANGNQYFQMTSPHDYVALFGGIVADLDKDNNEEVYLPLYSSIVDTLDGSIFVIDYSSGDNVQIANATHGVRVAQGVAQSTTGTPISNFTGVVADLDGNGKQEILIGSSYPSNVVGIEYTGGSVKDPASYVRKVFYTGESDNYSSITYRDSAGVKDTLRTIGEGFVSKMSKPIDIDGDGRIEIILPYQSLNDSMTITWSRYVADSSRFITDSTKKMSNPKKWAFRSLERDAVGSVIGRDVTVITPDDYQLNQNYPNPFNPATTINFVLPLNKKVTAKIYDMLGKEVRTLINNQDYVKGPHNVVWNGRDNNGRQVASGTYIFRMTAGNVEKSMKMMMLK